MAPQRVPPTLRTWKKGVADVEPVSDARSPGAADDEVGVGARTSSDRSRARGPLSLRRGPRHGGNGGPAPDFAGHRSQSLATDPREARRAQPSRGRGAAQRCLLMGSHHAEKTSMVFNARIAFSEP